MLLEVPLPDPADEAVDRAMVARLRRRLARMKSVDDPYPHFVTNDLVDPAFLTTLLEWLEGRGRFVPVNEGHYSLHRCENLRDVVRSPARSLVGQRAIEALASELGRIFDVPLGTQWIYFATHCMQSGQFIAVHTDPPDEGGEDVRLVIHLARPEAPVGGGELLLLRTPEDETADAVVPIHGASAAFVLSHRSFHAVNPVLAGTRRTIVFGFYREGRVPDELRGAARPPPARGTT
ncbi:MAG: 2OG-Fe(II) oxygenase [Labilithrix sp.]|nr:2OG-Fe(II) oxygenase [Labilithrix sp.]MCW5810484.1 2OG-Fe(II) oxygenase [Labilithrix sp.]